MRSFPALLILIALPFTNAIALNHGTVHERELSSGPFFNSTADSDKMMCGYQLSGNYCILNRVLYYALILFSIIGHSHVWLIAGALASALTYSGTAAVHAVSLCIATRNGIFDIDILGAWTIVSVACMAVVPIFSFSSAIRESVVSPIFGLWGTLVGIGAICSIVSFDWSFPDEAACWSNGQNPQLLTSPSQLANPSFNCTYKCFATQQILRSPSEIIALPVPVVFDHFQLWQVAAGLTGALGIWMAVWGFCMPSDRKRTEAELHGSIKRNRPRSGDIPKVRRQKNNARKRAQKELRTGEYAGNGKTITCWSLLSCIGGVIIIILNEVFLLNYHGGFPYNEQPFAVGQWGPWAGVLLALLASALVKIREPRWRERQRVLASEKKAYDERKALQQQAKKGDVLAGVTVLPITVADQDTREDHTKGTTFESGAEMIRAAVTGDTTVFQKCLAQIKVAAAGDRLMIPVDPKAAAESLAQAAGNGHLEIVRMLVESGVNVNVNATDIFDMTALGRAAWAGHEDIVRFLVLNGAQVACADGKVAWSRAKINGHSSIVQFLEEHGATSQALDFHSPD